jgi:hypothetical protein
MCQRGNDRTTIEIPLEVALMQLVRLEPHFPDGFIVPCLSLASQKRPKLLLPLLPLQ